MSNGKIMNWKVCEMIRSCTYLKYYPAFAGTDWKKSRRNVLWAAGLLNTKQSSNPSTAVFHYLADTLIYNLKSLPVVTSENDIECV